MLAYNNIIDSMDQLKEYKKVIKIKCLSLSQGNKAEYSFEVKFQQINPHRIFKFVLTKSKDQLIKLYERLQAEIFDFDNPFHQHFFNSLTKPSIKPLQLINQSLDQCTSRIDILIHHHFISFFCLHIHYPDFLNCLKEEPTLSSSNANEDRPNQIDKKDINASFKPERPWLKGKEKDIHQKIASNMVEKAAKPMRAESEFESMINMINHKEDYRIQSQQQSIIDFIFVHYYESEFLIVLEECKKATKITNIFKTFFSEPKPFGYVSIHKKEGNIYKQRFSVELQAEPKSIEFNAKTNMVMVLTTVGIFVYLVKMGVSAQIFEIFTFIELVGTSDFSNNCFFGEIYLVRNTAPFKLYVYSLKEQKLMETEYKYKNALSICFEQNNSRLFVSDQVGIFIYLVNGGLDIKKLHWIKNDEAYLNITAKLGYLYCISSKGQLIIIELKPPQKEQLMSITTSIGIPSNTKRVVGAKSQRLIISCYRDCIVLIDTIEGPINSFRLKHSNDIKALFYDKQSETLMSMTSDGMFANLQLNKRIQ